MARIKPLDGIQDQTTVAALVARARANGAMDERDALKLAVNETRSYRRRSRPDGEQAATRPSP